MLIAKTNLVIEHTSMLDISHSHRKVSGLGLRVVSFTVSPILKLYDGSIASSLNEREGRGTQGRTRWKRWQRMGEKERSSSSPVVRHTYPSSS